MTVMQRNTPANPTLPHLNRHTVENPNLPSWLEDCANASLVLAVAPAGFGKTTAILGIHEHLREAGVHTAWIQLGPEDNHLDRFCQLIHAAIGNDQPVPAEERATSANLIDAVYRHTSFNFRLLDLVEKLDQPTAVFLDDFDHITDPHILQMVQNMVERAGPQCRFIIAARAQPQLKLLKLRAQGKVILIGFRELAFDLEQARTFFNARYQLDLDDASIERLQQSTEGWPTGLQLAALAMEKRKDRQSFIKNFQISAADIDHYLNEEVFLTQSSEVQDFLLKTSIVAQLNAPLANAIAGIHNSATLLRAIEQQNLFLLRVGESDTDYRFHPLFADYLQKKLRDELPDQIDTLHRHAADWYLKNDKPGLAIDHLLIAGDFEPVCATLVSTIWVRINAGQLSDCRRWLERIPAAVLDGHADLLVAKCWLHIFLHEYVLARNLAYRLRNRPELEHNRDYKIIEPLSLALMDQPVECANVLANQLNNINFSGPVAGVWHTIRAAVHMWTHRFDLVADEIDRATAIFRQYGSLYGLTFTIGIEANVLLAQGKVNKAIALLQAGLTEINERGGQNSVCSAHLAGYLAEALYEIGEYEQASRLVDEFFDLTCTTGMSYTIIASFRLLARSSATAGNYGQARDIIERGIGLGREHSLSSVSLAMKLELQYLAIQQFDAQPANGPALVTLDDLPWDSDKPAGSSEVGHLHVMQCRVWIRTGKSQRVVNEVPALIREAEQREGYRLAIKLHIVLAQALDALGRGRPALQALLSALQMCKGQNLLSTFIEEGPGVLAMLDRLRAETDDPVLLAHIQLILARGSSLRQLPHDDLATTTLPADSAAPALVTREIDALSDRELQILQCLAAGMPNKSIAASLHITEPTVKFHLRNINSKLRAKNRTHAVFIGRQLGLIH